MARKKIKAENISITNEQEKEKSMPNDKENIFNQEGELVVDVFETNSDFVVLTAIAGVEINDLDIAVEKDMMIIKGQRLNPHQGQEKKYFYQECYWGAFSKKIVLPENIDTKTAEAQIDKGVLMIKIPKVIIEEKKGKVETG